VATPTKAEIYKLLKDIKPYEGATQIGVSTKKADRTPELKFIKALQQYVNEKFFGNTSAALRALGLKRSRIRGIIQRTLGDENRQTGKISQGDVIQTTVPTPKNTIPVTEATTKVKYDKNFLKRKIKNFDKNKFYTPKDIANILGLNVSTKNDLDYLTATFKRFGVKTKDKTGQMKLYQLGDAVNKTTKGFKNKLVKGDRKAQTSRINIISKIDKPLDRFISNIYSRIRSISKDFDIFEPGAVEDVGHPMSVKITNKFPKLFKNSNINKISSLVFQDPEINQKVLEATGYEAKHEKLFARLNKLIGKKITPEIQKEILEIKKEMNSIYETAINNISKVSKGGLTLYNPRSKQTTLVKGSYFTGQENRIPKLDIKLPKLGETFKSEDLFADMSTVDQSYRVGQVHKINPNAKVLNDLTAVEKDLFEQTLFNQQRNNLEKFYTRAGYPVDEIAELNEAFDIGTDTKKAITNPKLISRLSKAGKLGLLSALGLTTLAAASPAQASEVKQPQIKQPTVGEPLKYDATQGSIVNANTDQKADQNQILEYIKDNPLKVTAGTSIGFAAQEVPGAYKAARDLGRGRVRSALGISGALRPVLTTFGTPLLTGLYEGAIGTKRLEEGETMTDILTDPLGPALGVSLMEPLSKLSGVVKDAPKRTMLEGARNYFNLSNVGAARPGITGQILRMGMSPRMIAGASRFLGLPGLALGLGMSGYDAYKNYQNQEGMIYNLFNRDE